MRLETRYIDIEKSISIIDRNFHIDLYRPYRWFTATLPVVDWCQTGDKSLMLTKIYDTNAVIRPQRIAMLRFMTPYWIKRPQWIKTPRILRIDPKLTLLQSLMIVSPISTRFDDEFQIVHQGDLQFFFFVIWDVLDVNHHADYCFSYECYRAIQVIQHTELLTHRDYHQISNISHTLVGI